MKIFLACLVVVICYFSTIAIFKGRDLYSKDLLTIRKQVLSKIKGELEGNGLEIGSKVFIRIFKEEEILELWLQEKDKKTFKLFKSYPICKYSGDLGPKLKEGDLQAPEGFYSVDKTRMNPSSKFHLSFNLGFSNSLERDLGRTGSFLMIHGGCVSTGCFAMTNQLIEEIYFLAEDSLNSGNRFFNVHCFPFKMSETKMAEFSNYKWSIFWENLKQGYDWFESKKIPPHVGHKNGIYTFKDDH